MLWGSEASAQQVSFLRPTVNERTSRNAMYAASTPDVETSPAGCASSALDMNSGRDGDGDSGQCTHRHDLDEDGGEVVEVRVVSNPEDHQKEMHRWAAGQNVRGLFRCELDGSGGSFAPFPMQNTLHLRIFMHASKSFLSKSSFQAADSCVALSPAAFTRRDKLTDIVARDLREIPLLLATIEKEWSNADSGNCHTSEALFKMLHSLVVSRHTSAATGSYDRLEVDVLVTGCEASLWIGEQFASDLQNLFPSLRVVAMSANKVIGVLSNSRGSAPMSGFAFSSRTMSLKKTVVLAISHSGQTFPTLHATHTLRKLCGDRVFVLSGSVDSKMCAAVGQLSSADAPWVARCWSTFAAWRPAEALTISAVACHQTCTELLLYLARKAVAASDTDAAFASAAGLTLESEDLGDLHRLNVACTQHALPEIVGFNADGSARPSAVNDSLKRQGRQWALHILEGPHSWCLSAAYIFVSVIWGKPIWLSLAGLINSAVEDGRSTDGSERVEFADHAKRMVLVADAFFYCFLPLFFALVLRVVQRRQLLARLGKRTLVVADVPYVHQLVENYVSKLFSLSYSIASLEVHGANAIDHLVHRFTHRVYRGTLIAVGRTDGRLFSQSKGESWILMAMQQCKAIMHLGCGPEIISVGHNPYSNQNIFSQQTTLGTHRPLFLCETVSDLRTSQSTEPMALAAAVKKIDQTTCSIEQTLNSFSTQSWGSEARGGSALVPRPAEAEPVGARHLKALAPGQHDRLQVRVLARWLACMHVFIMYTHQEKHASHAPRYSHSHKSASTQPNEQRTLGKLLERESSALEMQLSLEGSKHGDSSLHECREGRDSEKSHHSMHSARSFTDRSLHAAGMFFRDLSRHSAAHGLREQSQRGERKDTGANDADNTVHTVQSLNFQELAEIGGPHALDRAIDQIREGYILQLFDKTSPLELWHENRHASLERYVGFLVLFHQMAARVAAFAPLNFDVSRSQSQLRVATTAAPISAAEIQKKWADDFDDFDYDDSHLSLRHDGEVYSPVAHQ